MLDQRDYWFAADGYDKPALATAPTPWEVGFHGREDRRLNIDPDLRLIHLHRIDHELCRERHRRSSGWTWSERDLEGDWGRHNRIAGDEEFEEWYYGGSCFGEGGRSSWSGSRTGGRACFDVAGRFYRASTWVRDLRDRALYPETDDPAGHWQRIVLNRAVDARIASLDPTGCTAVGDQRGEPRGKAMEAIHKPQLPRLRPVRAADGRIARFDVVICEQVLEHVVDPWAAAANLRRLCAPGAW